MKMIRYAERIKDCRVLGPGNRSVLWVSGCCFDCEGCIAENFRKGPGNEASPEEMADWFLKQPALEGITLSGGEPMLQAEALADMMDLIRSTRDTGLIVYTGFVYEELRKKADKDEGVRRLLDHTDLLIDGPYQKELDDNRPYRGSSNQRFWLLTKRYREALDSYYQNCSGRKVDLILSDKKTLMIGVPSADQAEIWKKITSVNREQGGV